MFITLVPRNLPGHTPLPKPKNVRQKVDVLPERGHEYQYMNDDGHPSFGVVLGIRHVEVTTGSDSTIPNGHVHVHVNIEVHIGSKLM